MNTDQIANITYYRRDPWVTSAPKPSTVIIADNQVVPMLRALKSDKCIVKLEIIQWTVNPSTKIEWQRTITAVLVNGHWQQNVESCPILPNPDTDPELADHLSNYQA